MAIETTATGGAVSIDRDRLHFVLRRLHSITGIVPIGAYMLAHIFFENAFILGGGAKFDQFVHGMAQIPIPILLATEITVLWAPILYHALYGFVVMAGADLGTATHFAYRNSLLYALQRVSGVVAFVFIAWHAYSLRLSFYFHGLEINYALMNGILSNPGWFAFYVLGVVAALFHFCNGLFTFCITWGLTVSERSQALVQRAALGLFGVLAVGAVAILAAFR
ncbi:MAG: succinate dehydrogenase [Deltaproteobacteria bacterium]|nr:succinate dehydrogenase [Deltaproteobacteria bacterium]